MAPSSRVQSISRTAKAWRDPDHPARAEAVSQTLEADNRFTEEALAFAINQKMAVLTEEALEAWQRQERRPARPRTVGVIAPGAVPFDALDDVLAVLLCGHVARVALSDASSALMPAFMREVRRRSESVDVAFEPVGTVLAEADALITTRAQHDADNPQSIKTQCDLNGIPRSHRLLRGPCYGVAVLDGHETDEDREGLAEDTLLYEGMGPGSIKLIWAPRELDPDPYFEAMAHFRGVFPCHPDTPGTLQMQQAFLEAGDQPHAYGEGLEFLVSRGDPDVQRPGHLRWVEYDALPEVTTWITGHPEEIQHVGARTGLLDKVARSVAQVPLGHAHRRPLGHPICGCEVMAFLASL